VRPQPLPQHVLTHCGAVRCAEVSDAALRALPVPLPSASSVSSQQDSPGGDTEDLTPPTDYNIHATPVFNAAFSPTFSPTNPWVGVLPVRPAAAQEDAQTDHLLDSDDDNSQV